MKIINFQRNIENLHLPILTLEDGSKKLVNTLILSRIYGYEFWLSIVGKEFEQQRILEEYQKEAIKLFEDSKFDKLIDYCMNDVELTEKIYLRFQEIQHD